MDCRPPGSSVHGISQARILEWVAISFSRGSSQPRDQTWVFRIASRRFDVWANPIDTIRKLLELISKFSTVTGYKINTQKSLAFLYTNNEKPEREIKESILFTIATKRIKYLVINLPKETKELYTENYKTLMKEIKDDINRWWDVPCSWVGRINILKMIILPNAIYRFNEILIKLPMTFYTELEKKNSQYKWKHQRSQIAKAVLKEEWSWRNQPSWLQVILHSYSYQDSMILAQKQKYRPMEQDRKPRNKPMHLWVLYIWQRRQEYTMGKDSLFNKWCWETGQLHVKEWN